MHVNINNQCTLSNRHNVLTCASLYCELQNSRLYKQITHVFQTNTAGFPHKHYSNIIVIKWVLLEVKSMQSSLLKRIQKACCSEFLQNLVAVLRNLCTYKIQQQFQRRWRKRNASALAVSIGMFLGIATGFVSYFFIIIFIIILN